MLQGFSASILIKCLKWFLVGNEGSVNGSCYNLSAYCISALSLGRGWGWGCSEWGQPMQSLLSPPSLKYLGSRTSEKVKNKILELPHDITLASHLLILEIIQSYSNLKFTWGLSCVWEYLDFFFLFFLPSSKAKFNAIRCLNYFFQWEMFFSYLIKLKMWLLRYTFFKWGPQFNFLPCLVPKLCLFTSASDPWSVLGFNIALVIHVFSVVLLCNHGLYFCDICTMHLTV